MRSWTKIVGVETEQSKKVEYTELGGFCVWKGRV